jgi:hypothetical protein
MFPKAKYWVPRFPVLLGVTGYDYVSAGMQDTNIALLEYATQPMEVTAMNQRLVACVALCLLCFMAGCNQQAERERIAAEGRRQQVEHEKKMATLEAEHKQEIVALEAATKRAQQEKLEWQTKQRLYDIARAYAGTSQKQGRPPKGAEELKPHLENEVSLKSPRDNLPFEVAWGTTVDAGRPGLLLAWEQAADSAGGRWVLVTVLDTRYVKEEEFRALKAGRVAQEPPAAAGYPAPPAPKVIITDPKTDKSIEENPGKGVPPPK